LARTKVLSMADPRRVVGFAPTQKRQGGAGPIEGAH